MNLVIVESPTKAKTISNFLGKDFEVLSSYGHIRDLPKTKLGVDIEKGFLPKYVIPAKAKKVIKTLKEKASKADKIILASDEDREGEAIAWHLSQALKLKPETTQRIVFHQITKQAILEALKSPRQIDLSLVKAQQARRVLDRLVGYKLSPFLWRKIARGLSAGRVQSPALRLIVEREEEIKSFKPQEYWDIAAILEKEKKEFKAALIAIGKENLTKFSIKTEKQAKEIEKDLKNADLEVFDIKQKSTLKNPLPPFKTSSLQQEAFRKLRFSSKKTMLLAQKLYEGADLPSGRQGLITYMRTDSLNIAPEAIRSAQDYIEKEIGKEYLIEGGRVFKKKSKLAQEAHEAIRPADVWLTPKKVKQYLSSDEFKLYTLIWQRFVASQMKPAKIKKIEIYLKEKQSGKYQFKALGSQVAFDGYLKVYQQTISENILPDLKIGEILPIKKIEASQHFTQPPPRYNDASLVKTLESYGIGRPSTYAPIISTLQERGYIQRDENKNFQPTEIGILVNKVLNEHFFQIVDYDFTAKIEKELDKIAESKAEYTNVLNNFWLPFSKTLAEKEKTIKKEDIISEKTDLKCPLCGAPLVVKYSKYGKFLACSNFPNCKYKKDLSEKRKIQPIQTKMKCPKCQKGFVVIRRTRRGKIFYGCSRYPECDWASWTKPKELEELEKLEKDSKTDS